MLSLFTVIIIIPRVFTPMSLQRRSSLIYPHPCISLMRPANLLSLPFHAAEAWAFFLAAIEAVEVVARADRRDVMVGEDFIAFPYLVDAVSADFQEDGSRAVTRRQKDVIVEDERRGGV